MYVREKISDYKYKNILFILETNKNVPLRSVALLSRFDRYTRGHWCVELRTRGLRMEGRLEFNRPKCRQPWAYIEYLNVKNWIKELIDGAMFFSVLPSYSLFFMALSDSPCRLSTLLVPIYWFLPLSVFDISWLFNLCLPHLVSSCLYLFCIFLFYSWLVLALLVAAYLQLHLVCYSSLFVLLIFAFYLV